MRRLSLVLCSLALTTACAAPHSTGALWAQQNLEQEAALFRQSDAQRAAQAIAFEQAFADSLLSSERSRLQRDLATCAGPGPAQPLGVSEGDKVRDEIRLHAYGDAARLNGVAQLALADWRIRRAGASSNVQFCADAQAALDGQIPVVTADLLDRLPVATVTRDQRQSPAATTAADSSETDSPEVLLSQYALGYVDVVQAPSPLPQYLALVYGGYLSPISGPTDEESAARLVDAAAPAYPDWEPDALFAALRA